MVKVNRSEPRPVPSREFYFKIDPPPPDPIADLLIDNAAEARALRADLEARAKAAGIRFLRSELHKLVVLALMPHDDFAVDAVPA